jgi:hypothetical protein
MNATPNRHRLLLGALTAGAAGTVAAIPAMAAPAEPGPVFGLIEAHKAAWARFDAIFDGILNADHDEERVFAAETEAGRAADAALKELTDTPPTTIGGMRAVIEYLVELDGHDDYLPTLLRSSLLRSPVLAG